MQFADNIRVMTDSAQKLRIGQVLEFDGVVAIARGDALIVLYAVDASKRRSRWIFSQAENLAMKYESIVVLVIIADGTKPPDQATRAEESRAVTRMGSKFRHIIAVPEGSGFHKSAVRLVLGAYVAITGKGHIFSFMKDVAEGARKIQEVRTALTPSELQIADDVNELRAAVTGQILSRRPSAHG